MTFLITGNGSGDRVKKTRAGQLLEGRLGLRLHDREALRVGDARRACNHAGQEGSKDFRPVTADGAKGKVDGDLQLRRDDDLGPVEKGPARDGQVVYDATGGPVRMTSNEIGNLLGKVHVQLGIRGRAGPEDGRGTMDQTGGDGGLGEVRLAAKIRPSLPEGRHSSKSCYPLAGDQQAEEPSFWTHSLVEDVGNGRGWPGRLPIGRVPGLVEAEEDEGSHAGGVQLERKMVVVPVADITCPKVRSTHLLPYKIGTT